MDVGGCNEGITALQHTPPQPVCASHLAQVLHLAVCQVGDVGIAGGQRQAALRALGRQLAQQAQALIYAPHHSRLKHLHPPWLDDVIRQQTLHSRLRPSSTYRTTAAQTTVH